MGVKVGAVGGVGFACLEVVEVVDGGGMDMRAVRTGDVRRDTDTGWGISTTMLAVSASVASASVSS